MKTIPGLHPTGQPIGCSNSLPTNLSGLLCRYRANVQHSYRCVVELTYFITSEVRIRQIQWTKKHLRRGGIFCLNGAPGRIRTSDRLVRSLDLKYNLLILIGLKAPPVAKIAGQSTTNRTDVGKVSEQITTTVLTEVKQSIYMIGWCPLLTVCDTSCRSRTSNPTHEMRLEPVLI